MMVTINDSNFEELVIKSEIPVLLDFWAPWCGPCKMLSPIVDELAQEYEGKWLIAKVNVDDCSEVPMKYGIRNIPTLLFFKGGEMKDKMVGSTTKGAIVQKMASIE
ncbi:MAG: thioredoxin [Bacteroidales bacterium]|nr:thioredoxin [Bacteroidales bacterium]MBO7256239.1 thioredoxin [Bacteroidales bacterium]MBO7284869.1 thioredoxin [Bacteroidales bacterium]MBO7322848.1 thioredoxin [Bacteroidales bacterium]MBQ1280030.1 thioredoxin [Bacteroidales bacterium]